MLKSDEITEVVHFYPVLSELPPALVHALVNSGTSFRGNLDAALFDFSLQIQSFILLTSGTIRVTRQVRGRERVLYRVNPGDYCIMTVCNLLNETFYQAISTAETKVGGVDIPAMLFKQMIEQSPAFSISVFRSFSIRLYELLARIDEVNIMHLDARLADLLLSKGDVVRVTHSQLANELGSVREVVSRILKDFETRGLVTLDRKQIHILDEKGLINIARNL